jgi:hypothetical protein
MGTAHWEHEGLLADRELIEMTRENLLEEIRRYRLEMAVGYATLAETHVEWIAEELEVLGGLAGAW